MGEQETGVINTRPACAAGMVTRQRVERLEQEQERVWEIIERVQARPPVWATVGIGILTGLVGLFAGIAFRGG